MECVLICLVVLMFILLVLVSYFVDMGLVVFSWLLVVMNCDECFISVFCNCLLNNDNDSIVVIERIMVNRMIVSLLCLVLCLNSCYVRFVIIIGFFYL